MPCIIPSGLHGGNRVFCAKMVQYGEMNYASIRTHDIANGEGVRVSLFVSGCTHRCKGCFNEEAQNFSYGKAFTAEVEDEIIEALKPDYIAGLTLLGGEPMEPANQRALVPFLRRIFVGTDPSGSVGTDPNGSVGTDPENVRKNASRKTLWVYTGCTLEQLKDPGSRWHTEVTDEFLAMTDVLVDGPFIEELKDISLQFRGSSNQRIIRLRECDTDKCQM